MNFLQPLLERAFESAPAPEANARIQIVRERLGGQVPARSYEVVVPESATLEWFAEAVMPRFVYHLESLGAHPPEAPAFFVSVFAGSTLYFLRVDDVFSFAAAALELTLEQMLERWGTGEQRAAVAQHAPPLALPGADPA